MLELHRVRDSPVLGIAHTGQVPRSVLGRDTCDEAERVFSLAEQIEHKLAVIQAVVPAGSRLHLFGHSAGTYICLQLIDRLENPSDLHSCPALFHIDTSSDRRLSDDCQLSTMQSDVASDPAANSNYCGPTYSIERCYLLCPTFERIAESSSGRVLSALSKSTSCFSAMLTLLGVLHLLVPRRLRYLLLSAYLYFGELKFRRALRRVRASAESESPQVAALRALHPLAFEASVHISNCVRRGCEQLVAEEWGPMRCGLHMGADLMRAIGPFSARHAELLAQPRFLQLHTRSDHWSPPEPTSIPGARSLMDPTNTLEHAFVFHSGAQVVHLVDMIESNNLI